MPTLMFLFKMYSLQRSFSAKLNSIILKYFLGPDNNSIAITEITKNRNEGGYGLALNYQYDLIS